MKEVDGQNSQDIIIDLSPLPYSVMGIVGEFDLLLEIALI